MKKLASIFIAFALLVGLVACGQNPESVATSQPQIPASAEVSTAQSGTGAKPVEDRTGKPIDVPENVEKIVSLAASTTRILDDLGLADKLVAIDISSEPNIVNGKPENVLVMDMMAPDLEQLTALSPDIVFVSALSSSGGEDIFAPLRNAGVCIVEIPTPETVAATFEDVQFIADCVGEGEKGRQIISAAQGELDEIISIVSAAEEKPVVYFEISPAPYLYTSGTGTYLNDMIQLAGGTNLFASQQSWAAVTEEAVVEGAPEIIFTGVSYLDNAVEEIMGRDGWENIPAVKNQQVVFINTRDSQEPTHHLVEALRHMAQVIHPELFK